MKNVTDRISNPFGMSPPCPDECDGHAAVFGYGDANADFHVVGDHPGVHGGRETGVPFTGCLAGERLQAVLHEVGLVGDEYSDEPAASNLFLSYLHACCLADARAPTGDEYAALEPFFDSELRAIAAHVLLPVGERATRYVLHAYTAREALLDDHGEPDAGDRMADLHADHVPGRGFLVVPIRDPNDWTDADHERLVESLADLLDADYRQTADLGRFVATDTTYEVR